CSRPVWDTKMPKRQILQFARDLAALTGSIPPQGFPGMEEISVFDPETQVKLVTLGKRTPTPERIRAAYGSWLAVLIKSGVLPEGTQRMTRGTRCIAKDGHVCHSLPEKAICDFFTDEGIEHAREPRYPGSNLRADFLVGDIFIEYLGLTGTPAYDAKSEQKREIAQANRIKLIELFPEDMVVWPATRQRLIELLTAD
ncbi:MAG: hypothetical protein LLG14_18215, partial [Nocardiaceae bacterium]|nr:hypothetical protein [Nocardiaceae bacterium]